jgi:predicted Zn-dependent protease
MRTVSRRIPQTFARLGRGLVACAMAVSMVVSANRTAEAQRSLPVVRDAEIEALVRDYARPIFKAAGISGSGIKIILVNDPAFNAFVAGRRLFINTGALMTADTPNEIIGVIAHEAGHIAGGHEHRLRRQLEQAQTMAIVAAILGIGAGIAGAATDTGGLAQAGTGLAMAGGEVARRGLLSYQRSEEATADRSAITYLNATHQSAKGMLTTFKRFESALALSGTHVDPYQVSHPMPRDRIANLQALAEKSPYFGKTDPAALQLRHDLSRAKIAAYTEGRSTAARIFRDEPRGLPALYANAIATYLSGNPGSALKQADALIKSNPRNPYFQELRGDILMKLNKPADAAKAYSDAYRLDSDKPGLLLVSYGQALLATGDRKSIDKAVDEINKGLAHDRENVGAYRYLAQAYGQLGEIGEAELATAEGYYYSGVYLQAKIFAARAQQKLKRGSPGWVRAQDIINYREPGKKK